MRRSLRLRFALAFVVAAAASQAAFARQQTVAPSAAGADAGGVVLHVTVAAAGGYASGVKKSSFVVFDDKVPREITLFQDGDVPASVGIVLDTSELLSVRDEQRHNVAPALIAKGLSKLSASAGQGHEFFVMGFGERPQLLLDWTQDAAAVESVVASVKPKGSPRAFYDACLSGLDKLAGGSRRKRVLIVFVAGSDNKSQRKFEDVRRRVKGTDVLVYPFAVRDVQHATVGLDAQSGSELAQLALLTGGRPLRSIDVETLGATLANLALELQKQYMIGFEPGGAADGKYHKLDVRLTPVGNTEKELRGLRVRGREGYTAAAK